VTVFKADDTTTTTTKGEGTGGGMMMQGPTWVNPDVGDALVRFRQWSNPACAQMVKGVAEIQGDIMRYRALQFFILIS
jgi:hypothetical protein